MTGIVDFAIGRARMILAIFVCALIAGLIAFATLPREADPDIPFPFVIVVVPLDGISPEDAERLIVRPTETEMRAIEGLEELNGTASLGAGTLVAEFDVPFDADQSVLDVREAVDMQRCLFTYYADAPRPGDQASRSRCEAPDFRAMPCREMC